VAGQSSLDRVEDLGLAVTRAGVPSGWVDRIHQLLRRNPRLFVPATVVAMRWSGPIERLGADDESAEVVTPEMLSALSYLADAIETAADDPELAAAAGRIAETIGSEPLAGISVAKVVGRLLEVAAPKLEIDDASLRLSGRERGLARDGETVLVPASAHARGALGTRWRTDLVITAVGDVNASVSIALLPRDEENSSPVEVGFSIDGGRSLFLEDVLDELFDFNGAAALRLTCHSGSVAVTSRTYNLEGQLGDPDARTFGQFLPALTTQDAVIYGDEGRLLQLAHDPSLSRSQRTNLILVNGGDRTIEVEIDLYSSDGTDLGEVVRTLRAWEYTQIDGVFEEVTSAVVEGGYATVEVDTGGGRLFALASVVDNLTGDPVAVPAVLRAPHAEPVLLRETQVVQAAAKVEGVGDTDWRTDMVLHGLTGDTPTTFAVVASVALLPRGQANTSPETRQVMVPIGQSVRYDDVLESLFETDGAASIWVTPYGGAAGVSSRTYNLLADGNAGGYPAGATFGQYLGPTAFFDSIAFGEEAWIQHLSHDPSLTQGSRTNLGIANTTIRDIDVEVDLHQGDGTLLGSITQRLRQWENVQIGRVFERVTNDPVEGGYAVLRTTHPSGAFVAHGSVVDNRTGDPITVDAVAIRAPAASGLVASGDMLMQLFETGLTPGVFFEALRAGDLAGYLDDLADEMPDRVERTANGMVFDLGAGTPVGDVLFASGKVGFEDASATDGTSVTGSVTLDFGDVGVDGRAPVVDDLELGLDLARVGSEQVAGTVTLASTTLAKSVSAFSGSLQFDTRICELYPIGGSVTVTIGGEVRTLTFTDRCDGGFSIDIPSASFYLLTLPMKDCQGNTPAEPEVIHMVDEDGELSVDPSSPARTTGRVLYSTRGRVDSSTAAVGFSRKAGSGSSGERRVGSFRGSVNDHPGQPAYWAGIYSYTVSEGDCRSSYHHGRDDPGFEAATFVACTGPCWQ
jgi:hypothetical protein